jgi:hypothetical protein
MLTITDAVLFILLMLSYQYCSVKHMSHMQCFRRFHVHWTIKGRLDVSDLATIWRHGVSVRPEWPARRVLLAEDRALG